VAGLNGTELRPVLDKKEHAKPGIMGLAGYEKTSPFLPGFSSKLQGSSRRRQLEILREKRDEAIDSSMAAIRRDTIRRDRLFIRLQIT